MKAYYKQIRLCRKLGTCMRNPAFCGLIVKVNMHKPCVIFTSSSVCLIDGACSKRKPMQYVDESIRDARNCTYVTYRGRTSRNRGHRATWTYRKASISPRSPLIDNAWVVLYSPILSIMFQSHLDVELCISRVCSTRCLFRDICKRCDHVSVQLMKRQCRCTETT